MKRHLLTTLYGLYCSHHFLHVSIHYYVPLCMHCLHTPVSDLCGLIIHENGHHFNPLPYRDLNPGLTKSQYMKQITYQYATVLMSASCRSLNSLLRTSIFFFYFGRWLYDKTKWEQIWLLHCKKNKWLLTTFWWGLVVYLCCDPVVVRHR